MKLCTIEGCDRPRKAKGLCGGHYARLLRGMDLAKPLQLRSPVERKICSVEGCGRIHFGKGYCQAHWNQFNHGKEITPLRPRVLDKPDKCTIDDCASPYFASGYCVAHYHALHPNGTTAKRKAGVYPRTNGQFLIGELTRKSRGPCSVECCDGLTVGQGLCRKHYDATYYAKWKRND